MIPRQEPLSVSASGIIVPPIMPHKVINEKTMRRVESLGKEISRLKAELELLLAKIARK